MGDYGGADQNGSFASHYHFCILLVGNWRDLKVPRVSQQVRHGQQRNTTISALLFAGFAPLDRRRHRQLCILRSTSALPPLNDAEQER